LGIDLFVFVATLAAVVDRRRGHSTVYAWGLAVLYSAATVAGNVAAAGPDHLAQAVHAAPAVTMVLGWHLLSRFLGIGLRRGRPDVAAPSPDRQPQPETEAEAEARKPNRPAMEEVLAWVATLEQSGQRATGELVAARFGVSDRTGRRMLTGVRSRAISG
jgi:hypothetical protein